MASNSTQYCDLTDFNVKFYNYYFYLSFVVCGLGTLLNCLNICVLSTKPMRCPTNYILTSLAVADILVMLEYIPFVYLSNFKRDQFYFTFPFAAFIKFHALFTQAGHFISCTLTIVLAVWRYIAVKFPQNNLKWCSSSRTKWTIFLSYTLCPFVCTPLFFFTKILNDPGYISTDQKVVFYNKSDLEMNISDVERNITLYHVGYLNNPMLANISFLLYGLIIKLVPCVLLTVLSILLIIELLKAKKRRKALLNPSGADNGFGKKKVNRRLEKEKQADRTTRMLLAVLLLFLMVEFPQAIFGVLNQIIGTKFEIECYRPLGDLLDLIALINSAINFVLYCAMSQKFRDVFKQVFLPCVTICGDKKDQWISLETCHTIVEL